LYAPATKNIVHADIAFNRAPNKVADMQLLHGSERARRPNFLGRSTLAGADLQPIAFQSIAGLPQNLFDKAPIHRAELLVESEQNAQITQGVTQNTTVSRVGVRVRKDVFLSPAQSIRLRAQVGYSHGSNASFFDGESDGALRYQPGALGLMGGLTVRRALDGTRGHDRHALYLGGVLLLETRHEIELRWQRSWDAYRYTKDTDLYSLEYTYQF